MLNFCSIQENLIIWAVRWHKHDTLQLNIDHTLSFWKNTPVGNLKQMWSWQKLSHMAEWSSWSVKNILSKSISIRPPELDGMCVFCSSFSASSRFTWWVIQHEPNDQFSCTNSVRSCVKMGTLSRFPCIRSGSVEECFPRSRFCSTMQTARSHHVSIPANEGRNSLNLSIKCAMFCLSVPVG